MDKQLKQRVVGAAVLVVIGVIFIPIFLDNGDIDSSVRDVADIPPPPADDFASRVMPLDENDIATLQRRTRDVLPPPVDPLPPPREESSAPTPSESTAQPPPEPSPTGAVALTPQAQSASEQTALATVPAVSANVEAWTVQLGSFASDKNAKRLIEKLREAGYPAYLERRVEQDVTAFKVRVGPQIRRQEAEQLREKLESEFALKGMLLRYR